MQDKNYHKNSKLNLSRACLNTLRISEFLCSGGRHISISDNSIVQFAYKELSINGISRGHNVITYRIFENSIEKSFLMSLPLKVGTKYSVQPIRMICGYNGKGCFCLSLTNMPP